MEWESSWSLLSSLDAIWAPIDESLSKHGKAKILYMPSTKASLRISFKKYRRSWPGQLLSSTRRVRIQETSCLTNGLLLNSPPRCTSTFYNYLLRSSCTLPLSIFGWLKGSTKGWLILLLKREKTWFSGLKLSSGQVKKKQLTTCFSSDLMALETFRGFCPPCSSSLGLIQMGSKKD